MAAASNLPIYKVAYDLFGIVTDAVRNMPRDVKQLVGSRVATEAMDIVTLIFRANAATNKVPHLNELLERLEVINLLLRLARDKRMISTKQYAAAIALTDQVGKQAGGWRKHSASSPAVSRSRP
ncbi:four helix bundle protein [Paraburkholderia caballeronis]|uniref:four helix bundle protein n=1 Tax=Paraburkholderia caballeronis TaxID=416943 RepID=UPI0010668E7B|nr:four helix bundle protein [Paraburkholderia caballeronis]TDV04645.1 23S rRNA-intervening sequence protein [Paraburkholderia caballeronis]TDV07888.1 23S rRNA-intervening sequence protein [Paraburkholderia caballeronis]TDV18179.1 23S rRNA-intervening sequence protein [Paraburkholderia caballeronis]